MKRRFITLLWRLLPGFFALTACSVGGSQPNFVSYRSETLHVSFEYPDGWVVEETEGRILAASSKELTTSDRYEGGATATIVSGPSGGFEGDLVAVLSEFVALAAEQDGTEVISRASPVEINAQDAATTRWLGNEGDTEVVITASVIQANAQILFLITIYDRDEERRFGPLVERMTNSMTLEVAD